MIAVRCCPQCGSGLEPFFDSTCEPPVAWLCQGCRSVLMDVPADALSAESRGELANLQAFLRAAGPTGPAELSRARARARAFAAAVREIPVDVERLAEQCGYPVRDRPLPAGERGTIARDGGRTVIVINRDRLGQAAAERRWVIAEELGHAALEHSALVASSAPGEAPEMPEPRRRAEEREAKAFAAEILMPAEKVRGRFAELAPRIRRALGLRHRETETGEVIGTLARMFGVTPTAMRMRLEELDLIH